MNERLARSLVLGPELLIAFLAIIASISGLVDPSVVERSSVGKELAPWDTIWNVAYGILGIVTIVGVVRGPRSRYLEAAGLRGRAAVRRAEEILGSARFSHRELRERPSTTRFLRTVSQGEPYRARGGLASRELPGHSPRRR